MSLWTNVSGIIEVSPWGCTQSEKRYVLETTLDHLPRVTGSEENMRIHIVQEAGYSGSANFNEFLESIPGEDFKMQDRYYLVLEGRLRDRVYEQTLRELTKFLNRLAKRVQVTDILVKLKDASFVNRRTIISNPAPYIDMFEDDSPWCEYLFWERDKSGNTYYPEKLVQKYSRLRGRTD